MYHFSCDTCDYSRDIDYLPRVYALEDGSLLEMLQRHIWCSECDSISVAEAFLADPDMLKARLESQISREPKLRDKWISDGQEFNTVYRNLQKTRSRPQCCLKCGNEQIVVPPKQWANLEHQTCGGILVCEATFQIEMYRAPEPHKYTIEGELIECGYHTWMRDQPETLELWSVVDK